VDNKTWPGLISEEGNNVNRELNCERFAAWGEDGIAGGGRRDATPKDDSKKASTP